MSEVKLGSSASSAQRPRADPEPAESTVVDPKQLDPAARRVDDDLGTDFADSSLTPVEAPPRSPTPTPVTELGDSDPFKTLNVLDDQASTTLPLATDPGLPSIATAQDEVLDLALETLPADTPLRVPPPVPPAGRGNIRTVELNLAAPAPPPPPPTENSAAKPLPAVRAPLNVRPLGKLVVIKGNDRGEEMPLEAEKLTLGRALDNDLVLADISVSRRHVLIGYDDGEYYLEDLTSGNGTLLNGKEVSVEALRHGDLIEIGTTVVRFQLSDGMPLPPVSEQEDEEEEEPELPTKVGGVQGKQRPPRPRPPDDDPPPRDREKTRPPEGRIVPMQPSAPPQPPQPPSAPASSALAMPWPGRMTGGPPQPPAPTPPPPVQPLRPTGMLELSYRRLIVIAGATLAAAFLTSFIASVASGDGLDQNALAKAESTLGVALQYVRTGRWDEAREQLLKANALAPTSQGIKLWLQRCELELKGRGLLEEARTARDKRAWSDARRALREVHPIASAAEQSELLLRDIERESAREQAEQAGQPRTRPTVTPIAPTTEQRQAALEAYLRHDFNAAAERCGSPTAADQIRKIATIIGRADTSEKRGNYSDAMRALEDAIERDRALPLSQGAMGRDLRPRLARIARAEAKASLDAGKLEPAFAAATTAVRLGGRGDLVARRVLATLEEQAGLLCNEAKRRPREEALRMYRRVLKIVPPTSQWYRQASKALDE